jgi:hypothetical protein
MLNGRRLAFGNVQDRSAPYANACQMSFFPQLFVGPLIAETCGERLYGILSLVLERTSKSIEAATVGHPVERVAHNHDQPQYDSSGISFFPAMNSVVARNATLAIANGSITADSAVKNLSQNVIWNTFDRF